METLDYAHFVQDCIAADTTEDQRLTDDEMYGLYLSWCFLHHLRPATCKSFWAAMSSLGFHQRRKSKRRYIRPGLRMTGPAAVDYILANRPSLL
ncbi:hypothetical protein [Arthrobacter sp. UYEF3]|uniref:hypothetical protein n=1 Tax=Arthrobacter sp. UYEF3 TaxID=1756365 RepID=UPI003392BFCE